MEKIKAIIIEDEAPAVELVKEYLKAYPQIEIVDICNDGFSGIKSINLNKPDLIFLDVQMPKLTGFEMLELIEDKPYIIFTTAFDEFAIKAFELNAIDYLLKPFSRERFDKAISKAEQQIINLTDETEVRNKQTKTTNLETDEILDRIVVKKNSNIIILPLSTVSHIEAYDDYVIIHSEGQKHLKMKTMSYYEKHLPQQTFIRIHRSYIVNIEFIEQIMLWEKDTYMVKLKSSHELRASRAGYKRLKEFL